MSRENSTNLRTSVLLVVVILGIASALETAEKNVTEIVTASVVTTNDAITEIPRETSTLSSFVASKKDSRWDRGSFATKSPKGYPRRASKTGKDSYLEALRHSRTSEDPREGIVKIDGHHGSNSNRREYIQGPVYSQQNEYGAPKEPQNSYGPPKSNSGTSLRISYSDPERDTFSQGPSDTYSVPTRTSVDFKDQGSYGPPRFSYGPPKHQSSYGDYSSGSYYPPQQAYGPPSGSYEHGAPHGLEVSHLPALPTIDFSWPFALKLNAFTLAKILLKLVIFKLIVKFIAIICLLLFIPKLEIKKGNKNDSNNDDDDDEGRHLGKETSPEKLNLLTSTVLTAFEKYQRLNDGRNSDECGFVCRVRRIFTQNESWTEWIRLLKSYVVDETSRQRHR